ncbi:flippase [Massilimicrobiota sp. An134]|uniref:flippase n=1 Tax=Massilimicrobiota sp. An134 TaxID=1965557 RepID=UPI000B3854E3|nr:flippase [Massilimicrobiota sp. An134]OUQ28462.1 flippase [Massilimicrobiota sp. An134]
MKKKITVNYIFNLLYQILVIILPLITTPYVSRILGPDGIGTYSYTTSIVTYFILFGCIGLNLYGQREIAYYQNDQEKRSTAFFEILLLKMCTMTISIIIFIMTIQIMNQYKILFYIQIIDLIANMLDITYFYQGIEDFKKIVVRNVLVKILGIICIFAFVKEKNDLPLYAFIYSFSLLLGNLSMWITIHKYVCKVPLRSLQIKKHIKPTLILFFPQIAISIYTVLDRFMIGLITNNTAQIGYYEQAQKIVKLALTVVTSLSTVMLPRIANLYVQKDQEKIIQYTENSLIYTFLIAFPIMFGLIGISCNLIPWFLGSEFLESAQILIITSPIVVFIGISNILGFQYLIPTQRQKIYTISTIVGSCINLVLNWIFIPIFLSTGAAFASVIAELGVVVVQMCSIYKEINMISVIKKSKNYIFSSFIMFILIFALSFILEPTMIMTLILILIGILIYFGLLFLVKDKLIFETLHQFREKLK